MKKFLAAFAAFLFALAPLATSAASVDVSASTIHAMMQEPGIQVALNRTQHLTGLNPPSTWFNQEERDVRLGIGSFWWTTFCGQSTSCTGAYSNLSTIPVTGLYVAVAPGSSNTVGTLYQFAADDTAGYGGYPSGVGTFLPADPTQIMLQGTLTSDTANIGPLNPPGTSGQSIDYLMECQVQTVDQTPQTVNIVSVGGSTTATSANRDRNDIIACQDKAGAAATTGTQVPPAVDTGYIEVGYVAVAYGTATITSGMITAFQGQLFQGLALLSPFTTQGSLALSGSINAESLGQSMFGVAGSASSIKIGNAGSSTFTILGDGTAAFASVGGVVPSAFGVAGATKTPDLVGDESGDVGVGGYLAVTGGITASPTINGTNTLGNLMPCYTAAGATCGATAHFSPVGLSTTLSASCASLSACTLTTSTATLAGSSVLTSGTCLADEEDGYVNFAVIGTLVGTPQATVNFAVRNVTGSTLASGTAVQLAAACFGP